MKRTTLLAAMFAAMLPLASAQAAIVGPGGSAQGITYEITVTGGDLNSMSATFNLHISGINAVTDLEGGRSAVNDFAIGGINSLTGLAGTSPFGTFQSGGLDSSGCNSSGNFFCFNSPATNTSPPLPAGSTLDIPFTLTVTAGNFSTWAGSGPAFKIDWLGSQNNYDLVSQDFVGSIGPNPQSVPAPAVGAGLPGLLALALWGIHCHRRRRDGLHLKIA